MDWLATGWPSVVSALVALAAFVFSLIAFHASRDRVVWVFEMDAPDKYGIVHLRVVNVGEATARRVQVGVEAVKGKAGELLPIGGNYPPGESATPTVRLMDGDYDEPTSLMSWNLGIPDRDKIKVYIHWYERNSARRRKQNFKRKI